MLVFKQIQWEREMSPLLTRAGLCCVAFVVASDASAQTLPRGHVQFRIVERTGQTAASAADNVLDFAVQMMSPEYSVANFTFNIRIIGEAESRGTLQRGAISEVDGTYGTSLAVTSVVTRGGLASQYAYLAGINASFNGVINQSAVSATNGPDQEIFLIAGSAIGSALLRTPGMDSDGDGNPDTWSGNGSGASPLDNTFVPLDPALAGPYFGFGQFIDVYHFRYTVSDLTARTLHLALGATDGSTGVNLRYDSNLWGINRSYTGNIQGANADFSALPLDIAVLPAPPAAIFAFTALGLSVGVRRRL